VYLVVLLNLIVHGSYIGSRLAMALLALELGASPLSIGLMVALYSVAPLLLGIYSGKVSDRYGVWPPMLFGTILCGGGLLLPYVWQHVAALYASATVIGVGFVFYNVSVQNLAGGWGPRVTRAKNFSTLSLGYSISSFAGPLAVGYTIEYVGHAAAYLLLSLSTLIAVAVLLSWRKLKELKLPPPPEGKQSTLDLLRLPELRKTLIIGAMAATGWDLYMFYLPIYAHSIGLSASTIGILLGIFAVATLIVRLILPRLTARYTSPRVLAISMFGAAAMFVVFPFVKVTWLLATLSFGIGLALGCGQPITLLLSYNRSPEGRTGQVTGIRFALNHIAHTTVPILTGALGTAFGAAPAFLLIGAVTALSGYLGGKIRSMSASSPPRA